jgi:excinuclease ABC subunit B
MDESTRRRNKQLTYNEVNNVQPRSTERRIDEKLLYIAEDEAAEFLAVAEPNAPYSTAEKSTKGKGKKTGAAKLKDLEKEMMEAAKNLEFEKAAHLRDMIMQFKK